MMGVISYRDCAESSRRPLAWAGAIDEHSGMVTPARPNARRRRLRAAFPCAVVLVAMACVLPPTPLDAQPLAPASAMVPYPGSRRTTDIARGREFGADVVGWLALGRVLWSASYDQVVESPAVWPQDRESYGRRFITRSAQLLAIEATRHGAAAVLGRDPAYIACACEGMWRRLRHATAGVFTDFDAAGQRRAAWPRFLGASAGALMLGQLQPGQGKPGTVALRAMTTVGASWLGNVAKEFHVMPGSTSAPDAAPALERAPSPVHTTDASSDSAASTRSPEP